MNRFDIGRRIEAYRDKMKMSTQDLAERINRSQATISRIENGKQGLTFELLSRIASELRIHPFALLSDDPVRCSALLPTIDDKPGDRYSPSLLANALHGGRIKRNLRVDAAAGLLGLAATELESVELALRFPDDSLLTRMCGLYGLPADQMRILRRFDEEAPDTARGLAYLQQVFSHIFHMTKHVESGEERKVLDRIGELLSSVDSESPLPPDASTDDMGLFLNRLSLHLVNALKDKEFRGKMFRMAGVSERSTDEQPLSERG